MLELAWFSIKLFVRGKLLRNPWHFCHQISIGSAIALLLLIGLAAIGLGFWLPVIISSFITGAMMPFLLQDIKMGSLTTTNLNKKF
ncbi:MAG: hypothetical protein ACFBSE_24770 [Prochloraceae cyanobacterium]